MYSISGSEERSDSRYERSFPQHDYLLTSGFRIFRVPNPVDQQEPPACRPGALPFHDRDFPDDRLYNVPLPLEIIRLRSITRQLNLWLPLGLYIGLIFFFSSRPIPSLFRVGPDYLLHGLEYFLLGTFMLRALNGGWKHPVGFRIITWSVSLCILCALIDEFTQYSVPDRIASLLDVLSDFVGATSGNIAVMMLQRFFIRPIRPERS